MSNSLKCLWLCLIFALSVQTVMAVNTIDVSLEKQQLLLTPRHGGDGSAWGKETCSACHFKDRIHSEAPLIKGIVIDVGFSSCTGCHGQNGTDAPRRCTVCHNEQRLPTSPILLGTEKHDFSVNESHVLNDQNCVTCHHSSDMNGQFEFEIDLSSFSENGEPNKSGVEFCLDCHNQSHQQPGFEIQARFANDPLVKIETQYSAIEKHGFLAGTEEGVYSGLRKGGDYRYGDVVECTDCHAMHGTHNPKLIIDRTDKGATRLSASLRELPVLINVGNGDYSQLCVTCHSMNELQDQANRDAGNGLTGIHVVGVNCSQCHAHSLVPQEGLPLGKTVDVSLEKGKLLLTPGHGFGGFGWGKEECAGCHLMNRIHHTAPKIREIVEQVGFSSCAGCHGQNGTDTPRLCKVCHNQQRLPNSPIQTGTETHDFSTDESRELGDGDCQICHFSSDMDGNKEANVDLTYVSESLFGLNIPYKNGIEFCLRCHNESHQQPGFEMLPRFTLDPLVIIETSYTYLDVHGLPRGTGERTYTGLREGNYAYGDLVECTDCHSMHGTHNSKLIVDRTDAGMTRLDPAIRELPVLIDVASDDYSQLCVTCHSMELLVEQGNEDTGNGLAGVHQVGTNCTECHVHGLATNTGL